MTIRKRRVTVEQLPPMASQKQGERWLREMLSGMDDDRPSLVLDCSNAPQLNQAGISLMLGCLEEAMKRNGDVKLAALPAEAAATLEINGALRLFDVHETTADAINSFHAFSAASSTKPAMSTGSQSPT